MEDRFFLFKEDETPDVVHATPYPIGDDVPALPNFGLPPSVKPVKQKVKLIY